jgi:ribokinase
MAAAGAGRTVGARPIAVVGNVNADLSCGVARMPLPGETLLADSLVLGPGGKAGNASVAIAKLGVTPRLISGVGDDALGEMVVAALIRARVSVADLARRSGLTTGVAIVLVGPPGEENTIVTHLGANLQMSPDEIPPLEGCAGLLMTLGLPQDVLLAAVGAARAARIPVIVDATPLRAPPLDDTLTAVDVLSANRVEAELLTGQRGSADLAETCARLHALGAQRVVVKLGGEGAVWSDGHSSGHVRAPAVEAVDPTGAGDAFMAALAVRWLSGAELEAAVRFACVVGALATTAQGAQAGWSTLSDVDQLAADDAGT